MNSGFKSYKHMLNTNLSKAKVSEKNKEDPSEFAPKDLTADDLPDKDIYYQGWIKYFSYQISSPSKGKMPKFFFKNEAFLSQNENEENVKDNYGDFKIPSETSFFAVVYGDRLNILGSRKTANTKVVDSISIDTIQNIPDDAQFKGAVKDLGKFSEGYCFEILAKDPVGFFVMSDKEPFPERGVEKVWYICSESEEVKTKLLNLVIKLRLKKQHKVGLWFRKNDPPKKQNVSNLLGTDKSNENDSNNIGKIGNSSDGYWVLLQDWSTCTLKCGGGLQYQHLMCIPPKDGGKPCEGQAIRTRPCNQQACPDITTTGGAAAASSLPNKEKEKINNPIVKVLPISSRPLRYDKCHLKEGDAIFTIYKPGVGIAANPMKVPSRVIMNEKSVSVYTNEFLTSELGTFIIERTTFKLSSDKPSCFILDAGSIKGEFCNLDTNNKFNFVAEWNYDFNLFKNQCHTDRKVVALNDKEEKELKDELERKIDSAKLDVVKERTKKIQQKANKDTPINKVEKMQETAMLAIKKELVIDEMLEKEEMEKEESETRELKVQLENEKKKDECLIKSIKEKEMEDQYNLNKAEMEKEITQLKEEAKLQILNKRKQVKLKILNMRKRKEFEKKRLQGEITTLRSQVAEEVTKHNKEGNMDLCFKPNSSVESDKAKVENYCKSKFSEAPPSAYSSCLSFDNFCYSCCSEEFGDMHMSKKSKCYDKCDNPEPTPAKKSGAWQWVETLSPSK